MCKRSEFKVDELIRRTEAMTKEEMELVLDHIPVELCLARVSREIKKLKTFQNTVLGAVEKTE